MAAPPPPPRWITTEVWEAGDTDKLVEEVVAVEKMVRSSSSPLPEEHFWKEVAARLRLRVAVARSSKSCRERYEAAAARWKAAGAPSASVMDNIDKLRAARLARLLAADDEDSARAKKPRMEETTSGGADDVVERLLAGMRQIEERRAEREESWRAEALAATAALTASIEALTAVLTGGGGPSQPPPPPPPAPAPPKSPTRWPDGMLPH